MTETIITVTAVALFILGLAMVIAVLRRGKPRVDPERPPENAILVDGSNVMFWGGEPSEMVLTRVIRALEGKGFNPVVIFDASVGYRLADQFLNRYHMASRLGLPAAHVYVVNKGVVADEVILDLAAAHGLRVVSNDRFRDWRVQFPGIAAKGALVQGDWKEGNVVWRGKGF